MKGLSQKDRRPLSEEDGAELENMSDHYDGAYFAYQQKMGIFGGWAELPKFTPHIQVNDRVVDFGCGGGYLLERLNCAEKLGIEVNERARMDATRRGITVVRSADEINAGWADVVISNHALEHCLHPLAELQRLFRLIKPGGTIVFVVPCESIGMKYDPNNMDRHLYTWSPMTLGNLFAEAGYEVLECRPYRHRWPPGYDIIARFGGRKTFDLASRLYARVRKRLSQVKVVATKPVAAAT